MDSKIRSIRSKLIIFFIKRILFFVENTKLTIKHYFFSFNNAMSIMNSFKLNLIKRNK